MKILNFFKKYKYWIFIIILYILLFMHMQSVVMYADDYWVTFKVNSLASYINIITRELNYYFNYWSGRLLGHFTVISGLSIFGINFFRILNPIMIFLFSFICAKILKLKLNCDISKIIFWITFSILGINVYITRECLYWADGTILYLWGYVPLVLNIYIILKAIINKQKLSKLECFICLLLCTMINFIMESTQVFNLSFLFLLIFFYRKEIFNNKKIFLIFFYSIVIFILSFFIPGNLSRFNNNSFNDVNFLYTIGNRFYSFVKIFTSCKFNTYLFVVANIIIIKTNLKLLKKEKVLFYLLTILNIFNAINLIFNFINEYNFNIFGLIFYLVYIITIILFGYISCKENKFIINILLSGTISALFSVLLSTYWCTRFYFLYLLSSIIFIIYFCLYENNKEKEVILLSIIFCLNYNLFFILLIFIMLIKFFKLKKINLSYLCITIIVIVFSNRYLKTIYYYNKNATIFYYNNEILENKINTNNVIYVKKLPYRDYAFDLPYMSGCDYVTVWFNNYYNLHNYNIIWEEK